MTDPWLQAKNDLYLAIFTTAAQLYDLPVWSRQPDESPASTDGLTAELVAITRRAAFFAPAAINAAAAEVSDGARVFAAVIEDMRRSPDSRQTQGRLVGPQRERHQRAQHEFGARIDQFAVLARKDIGITSDYMGLVPMPHA